MATTALGGVVNIGPTHRNLHESIMEDESTYGKIDTSGELSSESYHHQSNSPGVLMTAIRSSKSEVSPASPDSTMSSSSSTTTEDSHVSVLRRGPSAAPPPFVPFTAPPTRIQSSSTTGSFRIHHHQPASVARRNARERNRVKQVNNGFATLRQHIPPALIAAAAAERSASPSERSSGRCGSSAAAKKMSKVETLRCAVEYIRSLQDLLREADGGSTGETQPDIKKEEDLQMNNSEIAVAPSPVSSPMSSPESSSAFLPPSPTPASVEPIQDGTRHYLPLQPVQTFDYIDIDSYARLPHYGADGTNGVLQFYNERVKREDVEDVMVLEPSPGVVASTNSPPPHGYSTSATAYLAMAPGPALIHRPLGAGDEVELVESDMAGMMTWWTEGPQC
ncbi:hypothetical protein J437_LFUL016624 [Ladona fulva]|uniref:BHLH domain-containing protein n=1 Tax=Ladona fulva TaxID=123851 RepID=A0A8K0P8R0_LADFU|nr:hypothetical protein J437_LFUL016624 [Ladona fulva]